MKGRLALVPAHSLGEGRGKGQFLRGYETWIYPPSPLAGEGGDGGAPSYNGASTVLEHSELSVSQTS